MPADRHDTLFRQWQLLKLLPARGSGRTAADLAAALAGLGLTVTKRTVERDLVSLSGVFPLHCNERAKPYGWRWLDGAVVDLPGLELSEALSLVLLRQEMTRLLPASLLRPLRPRFEQATRVLQQGRGRTRAARWLARLRTIPRHLELEPPHIDETVLEQVQEALMEDQELSIHYRSLQDIAPRIRVIEPRAILQRGAVTYLIATRGSAETVRQYALHRISRVEPTGRRVRESAFDLDRFIAAAGHEVGSGARIELVALVDANLAKILHEMPLTPGMSLVAQGARFRIEAAMQDTRALRRWILGHAEAIEVLEPATLRRAIAQQLGKAIEGYAARCDASGRECAADFAA